LHNALNDAELLYLEGKAVERFKEVVKRHCLNCKNVIKIKSEKKPICKEKKNYKKNKDIINNNHNHYSKINDNIIHNLYNNNNNTSEEKEFNNNKQKINFNLLEYHKNVSPVVDKEKEYNLVYNKNSYVKYYNIPIIPTISKTENPIEESFDMHLICDLCVDIVNQEIQNKIRLRSHKGKREVIRIAEIKCILCLKEHNVDYKNFKKFVKTGFQRCCNVL